VVEEPASSPEVHAAIASAQATAKARPDRLALSQAVRRRDPQGKRNRRLVKG